MAAFEVLGSFIATFADPSVTGLYLTDDGVLDFRPTNGLSEMYVSPMFLQYKQKCRVISFSSCRFDSSFDICCHYYSVEIKLYAYK